MKLIFDIFIEKKKTVDETFFLETFRGGYGLNFTPRFSNTLEFSTNATHVIYSERSEECPRVARVLDPLRFGVYSKKS